MVHELLVIGVDIVRYRFVACIVSRKCVNDLNSFVRYCLLALEYAMPMVADIAAKMRI